MTGLRQARVALARLEGETALTAWAKGVQQIIQGRVEGTTERVPAAQPYEASDDSRMVWRLIASNMRPLAVSNRRFVTIDEAHDDARRAVLRGAEVVPLRVLTRGALHGWVLTLDASPMVVSERAYRRTFDRDKALDSALRILTSDIDAVLVPLPYDRRQVTWAQSRVAPALRRQVADELERLPVSTGREHGAPPEGEPIEQHT